MTVNEKEKTLNALGKKKRTRRIKVLLITLIRHIRIFAWKHNNYILNKTMYKQKQCPVP